MEIIRLEDVPNVVSEILEKVNSIDRQLRASGDAPGRTEDGLLTITEAGELLHLSTNTMYKLVQGRKIPYSKRSKRLYFLRSELLSFIKEGRKLTETEIQAAAEKGFINANKSRRKP